MTPTGGSYRKLHCTTKILSHARRRGCVAARRACATAGDAGDWISESVTSDGGAALLILRRRSMIRKTLIICALSVSSFITTAVAGQSYTRVSISADDVK